MNHDLIPIVLENPFHRRVRHIPSLTRAYEALQGMGLIETVTLKGPLFGACNQLTIKGRIAQIIACQINPKRVGYRSEGHLLSSVMGMWVFRDHTEETARLELNRCLKELLVDGLITIDDTYKHERINGPAYKIRLDS